VTTRGKTTTESGTKRTPLKKEGVEEWTGYEDLSLAREKRKLLFQSK